LSKREESISEKNIVAATTVHKVLASDKHLGFLISFFLVGAASSREYCNSNMQPLFIAAGSRSHKGRYPS
jgi:hypothetical protein